MLMRAGSAKEKRLWTTAMRAAINAQSSAEWTATRNGPTEDSLRETGLDAMDLM
jgi:hypothetical protein